MFHLWVSCQPKKIINSLRISIPQRMRSCLLLILKLLKCLVLYTMFSVVSDSFEPHGLKPTRLLCPWDFPGKSTGVGCFHVLVFVNSATMNNGIHVSFSILVSSRYMPRSGIVGHMVILFLVFKGISIPSSIVAVSICLHINGARAFPFLHTLSRIYCL